MKLSIELIIAIWGAVVATVLAIITITKEFRQRPKILTDTTLAFRPCGEDEDTHGVKVSVQRGDNILFEEVFVNFTIRNSGLQSIQVNAIYVETGNSITQIIPSNFPVVLEPNTSVVAEVQPEWFAPSRISEDKNQEGKLSPEEVISIGVFDALSKKHLINKEELKKIVESCRKLPLRVGVFKHKKTGNLVSAFQTKDKSILIRK